MRILIDIQGCQSDGSRFRGIGRYSRSLIKSLITNYPQHEYIHVGKPIDKFKDIPNMSNISYAELDERIKNNKV